MSSFFSSIKKAIGIDSNSSDNNDDDNRNNINVHNYVNDNNDSNNNSHIPSITTNNNDVYDVYDIIFTENKLGLGLDRYHGLIPIIDNNFILNSSCNNNYNNNSSSIDKVDHSDNAHYQQPGNSYSATCPIVKTVDPNLQGFQKS
jgi:hypothetical protein